MSYGVLLLGGNNGFVGSGIHSLNSQIKSKSLRNEFEKRTAKGTKDNSLRNKIVP